MYSMSHDERLFYYTYDRLYNAISLSADGNLSALKHLIEVEGFNLSYCYQEYKLSAITIASMYSGKGVEDMVAYLLKHGAQPTYSALCKFAEEGNVSAMRKLFAAGLPINGQKGKQTILDFCLDLAKNQKATYGKVDPKLDDVFDFLVSMGAKTKEELNAEGRFATRRAVLKKESTLKMAKRSIKRQERKNDVKEK